MKRVQLSGLLLRHAEIIEDALGEALNMPVTDDMSARQIMKRTYERAKDTIIAIESIDMRLHPDVALELIEFCYEYGFQLDLIGEDREDLYEALALKFANTNEVDLKTARCTISRLFNGEDRTLIKPRDAKLFSVENIPETK